MSFGSAQFVKICGVRTADHACAAAAAGADAIGLVLAAGRRYVAPAAARTLVAQVRDAGWQQVRFVGVFVNAEPATICALAREIGLDIVQLSGDEPLDLLAALEYPVIKAVRLAGGGQEQAWLEQAAQSSSRLRLVADAHVPGSYGGAGVLGDWSAAASVASTTPLVLAGGLTPDSVAAAIAAVQPWGVDVSSGVESAGVKDHEKITRFISAARQSWRAMASKEEQ